MDTIAMDADGLVAGFSDPTASTLVRRDRARSSSTEKATRCNDRLSGPPWSGKLRCKRL